MSSLFIPNNKATDGGQKYLSIMDVANQNSVFPEFLQKILPQNFGSYNHEKVPNESKMILMHNIPIFTFLPIVYCFLIQIVLTQKKNFKCYFFNRAF